VGIVGACFYKFISMGRISKSQSIQVQSPIKSIFSNVDLVWIPKVGHGGPNKALIEIAYIAHTYVCDFLEGDRSDVETLVKWNTQKLALAKGYKNPINKKTTLSILGIV
jgi:hypothetical protein